MRLYKYFEGYDGAEVEVICKYKSNDDYEIHSIVAFNYDESVDITEIIEKHFPEMWEKIESINWAEIAAETQAAQKEYRD
jgi:deoxyribodipyrimidine photolyase-like uncharacterized protein